MPASITFPANTFGTPNTNPVKIDIADLDLGPLHKTADANAHHTAVMDQFKLVASKDDVKNSFATDEFKNAIGHLAKSADIKTEIESAFKTDDVKTAIKDITIKGGELDNKAIFKHLGIAAAGGLVPSIPASLAAWKAWSADSKLDKNGAALRQVVTTAAKDAKMSTLLKGFIGIGAAASVAGLFAHLGKSAGKRVV